MVTVEEQKHTNSLKASRASKMVTTCGLQNVSTTVIESRTVRSEQTAITTAARVCQKFLMNRQELSFPVFKKGDDPQLWIHIANQHFDLYQIPNQYKVSLSEAYIDDEVKCYQKKLAGNKVSWEDWSWSLYEEFNKSHNGFYNERIMRYVDDYNNNWEKITSFTEENEVNKEYVSNQILQDDDSTPILDVQPQSLQAMDSTPKLDEHIRSDPVISFTPIASFNSELVNSDTLVNAFEKLNGLLGEDEMFSLLLGKSDSRNGVEMDNKSFVVHERMENAHLVFDRMFIRGLENVEHEFSVIMGKALKLFKELTEGKWRNGNGITIDTISYDQVKNSEEARRKCFVDALLVYAVEHTHTVLLICIVEQMYDILLLHGGATGCGVALDAVMRGIRVRLVEREDCSYGTSSLVVVLACTAALAGAAVLNQGMKGQLISFNGKFVFSAAITSDGLFSLQEVMFVIKGPECGTSQRDSLSEMQRLNVSDMLGKSSITGNHSTECAATSEQMSKQHCEGTEIGITNEIEPRSFEQSFQCADGSQPDKSRDLKDNVNASEASDRTYIDSDKDTGHNEDVKAFYVSNNGFFSEQLESVSNESNVEPTLDEKIAMLLIDDPEEDMNGGSKTDKEDYNTFLSKLHNSEDDLPSDPVERDDTEKDGSQGDANLDKIPPDKSFGPGDVYRTFYDRSSWTPMEFETSTGNADCTIMEHPLKLKSTYTEVEDLSHTRHVNGEPEVTKQINSVCGITNLPLVPIRPLSSCVL